MTNPNPKPSLSRVLYTIEVPVGQMDRQGGHGRGRKGKRACEMNRFTTGLDSRSSAMAKAVTFFMVCIPALMLVLIEANTAASSYSGEVVMDLQQQGTKGNDQIMYGVSEGSLRPQECGPRCSKRCSATSFKKPCMFFCQKCCAKCLCVPPGTYGNKQTCPCYNNWKTQQGGPKCP